MESEDYVEMYRGYLATQSCIECHDWQEGQVGGVGYFRLKTSGLKEAIALANTGVNELRNSFLWGCIVTVAIVLLISAGSIHYVMQQLVIHPLQRCLNLAKAVAKGDLTHTYVHKWNDEMGLLSHSLSNMCSQLKQIIHGISESSSQVSSGSEELSASSQNLAHAATEQASSLEQTSAAMEELSQSIETNADNAKRTQRISENTSQMPIRVGKRLAKPSVR